MAQHGRYTVVRKLANGGMAEIFLASQQGHEGFQKPVVLKRILGTIYSDPQFRNMLIDEAHISMSLTHSNIVQVLDLGLAGGRYFLVLELVDGWDLGQVLQRGKLAGFPLSPELGIFIVAEVCRALAYAHAKHGTNGQPLGIVHRDVSPNNVLLSEHGEVKLADFGIAKAMNKREHTGTGVVKGKVAFMSPEQALGTPIDARSDVFSLGTLLYVVVLGVRPFEASTDLEILLRVQRAEFKPPERARPGLGPELARVIARAMRFSPDERYQTADEMLVDLERVLRSLYGGVGQTELKQYLADLGRHDGVPPIGRAKPVVDNGEPNSGAELREGNAVVLADAHDDLAADRTDLAEFMAVEGESSPRFTSRTLDLGRAASSAGLQGPDSSQPRQSRGVDMLGNEQTPARSTRRLVEKLSLLDGAGVDDGPPVRYGRNRRRSALPTLFVLAILGGGGFVVARHFGLTDRLLDSIRSHVPQAEVGGSAAPQAAPSPRLPAPTSPLAPQAPSPPAAVTEPSNTVPVPPSEGQAAVENSERGASAPPAAPPAVPTASVRGEQDKRPGAPSHANRSTSRPHVSTSRDVFRESARRVRSLSQGIDQLPPGTIQPSGPPAPEAVSPPQP
jgi:serine/threonine protein kinase